MKIFRKSIGVLLKQKNRYYSIISNGPDRIVRSPLSHTPVPQLTIDEFLLDRVDRWPQKTAIVCSETGRSFTFDEYRHLRESVAQAFCAKLGLKKGDVIATLLPNIPEYMTVFLAAFHAGIIITSINPIYTADEISRQMSDCSAQLLITLTQTYDIASLAVKKLNTQTPIVTIKHEKTDTTPDGAINFQELCDYNGPQINFDKPNPEDLALLPYSSGTSGLPKGVELKHRNVVANLVQLQHESVKMNYDTTNMYQDVVPMVAPLFHAYGMIPILFNMFSEGCKSVLLPKYKPNLYLDMLDKYPANLVHVVPPIVLMLINNENAKKHHLRSLRHAISAAAPLANTDIERFHEKFGDNIRLAQYYGLTETGPVTHAQRVDAELTPGSVGCTLSLTECKIVSVEDSVGNKGLGPNESGHLLVRSPSIMPGYHNNPNATRDAIDADGWFKTGDIAHYDENGSFFITERIKELIKVKGFQVAPAELEALIREHPDVEDVAVTGVPHERHGEAPKAFVVPREASKLKPEHVQDYVETKAAKHKHLTGGVVFIDAIPKNPSGKILRRMLKNL